MMAGQLGNSAALAGFQSAVTTARTLFLSAWKYTRALSGLGSGEDRHVAATVVVEVFDAPDGAFFVFKHLHVVGNGSRSTGCAALMLSR